MRVDVHQHLYAEPLVAALARRADPPRVRRRDGALVLELAASPPWPLPAGEDPATRAAVVERDGLDVALVALSSALGIETLPADEAAPLLAAHAELAAALPAALRAWGAVSLSTAGPEDVDALLDAGFVGLALPAGALATPAALDAVAPLLEPLVRRDAPLFVHPGPAATPPGAPGWWPALTGYVAGLSAAWHAVRARPDVPRPRTVFAALAGLAPLHGERLAARGGPAEEPDPRLLVDTSSYGPRTIRAVAAVLGEERIVLGSDRPVAVPGPDGLAGRSAEHGAALLPAGVPA